MLSFERTFLSFLRRHMVWIFVAVCLLAAGLARAFLFPIYSADMDQFLIPWYNEMAQANSISVINSIHSDYNIPYLTLLYFLTKLPIDPGIGIKLISLVGDLLLAWAVALLVNDRFHSIKKTSLAFSITLLLPLTLLNSAYWGQCDALYAAFLLFAIVYCMRGHYPLTFVFFGLALIFKLQAIFLLPAFIILYACNRKFSLFNFFIPPAILLFSSLPVAFNGGGIFKGFQVYFGQVASDERVFVNYLNVSTFFRWQEREYMGRVLIVLTFLLFFAMLAYCMRKGFTFSSDQAILLCAWSAWTSVLFLPSMHERYGFVAEILMFVWLLYSPSLKRAVPFGVLYLIGFMSCSRFLFGVWPEDSPFLGLANLLAWGYATWLLLKTGREEAAEARISQRAQGEGQHHTAAEAAPIVPETTAGPPVVN